MPGAQGSVFGGSGTRRARSTKKENPHSAIAAAASVAVAKSPWFTRHLPPPLTVHEHAPPGPEQHAQACPCYRAAPMTAPQRIGPYPIERELGRGGMGIVYLGRDARLDRPVAIKVLPEAFAADAERLARFEREAKLLASLHHPNIAGIYGLEESDGQRFLVLEYVEGETLAERIARSRIPLEDVLQIGQQIAAALEAAHESGVIHRD